MCDLLWLFVLRSILTVLGRVHGVGVENPGLEFGSLKRCRYSLFLSRSAPPLSCPSPFASAHLPPPPSGFTHPHVCIQAHTLALPGFNTFGFSHALEHAEKSGKSVPRLIGLKDCGLAGHCVSELQRLLADSVPYRTVQGPCDSSCCCSSPLSFPSLRPLLFCSSPLPLSSTFLCSFNPSLALPASTFTRNLTLEPEIFPAATDSRYLRAVSHLREGGHWSGSKVLAFPLIAPLIPCR